MESHEGRGAMNFREERITKLLHELRYEVTRGMMEREIDETLSFVFFVPISNQIPDGVVRCSFETRPVHKSSVGAFEMPQLRVVK
jgi:hypothetical protein